MFQFYPAVGYKLELKRSVICVLVIGLRLVARPYMDLGFGSFYVLVFLNNG